MLAFDPHRAPVRYHPPVGLSLLFTPLPKGGLRPVLDVSHDLGNGQCLRFSARQALGVPEQTLLLALLELAGEQYADNASSTTVMATDPRRMSGQLWSTLYPDGGHGLPQTVMIRTTWKTLNQRCGTGHGGSITEMRRASLQRLCEVVVWEEEEGGRRHTRQSFLLAWAEGDDRHVHLALNHRLAQVFFGGQYSKVWMYERLRLPTDVAMHVHAFLSTCIRPGHELVMGLSSLVQRVWPPGQVLAPAGTQRRRMSELKRAMQAVGRLGHWTVTFVGEGGKVCIRRDESHAPNAKPVGLAKSGAEVKAAEVAIHEDDDISALFIA